VGPTTLSENLKLPFEGLAFADLLPGAIYCAGEGQGISNEPLSELLKVGNSGGFRWKGSLLEASFVVLTSTGNEEPWPDTHSGRKLEYFGDKRSAHKSGILSTRGGNKILSRNFPLAFGSTQERADTQIFLYFSRCAPRDWRFEGIALPGARGMALEEALRVVVNQDPLTGLSYENYLASFTLVRPARITRAQLDSWSAGQVRGANAPSEWQLWVDTPGWWPSP
jgi:hypothetical protein